MEASKAAARIREAFAMRAPFDGWKGELESQALTLARAALTNKD